MPFAPSTFFPEAPPLGLPGSPGMFGPSSAAWRVGRERVLLAAGPAALLLQVAHPLVAAGVAEHSDFGIDPLRRLRGTLDVVLTVTFGDGEQARAIAHRVAGRHRDVSGALTAPSGGHPAGTTYRASDPSLALWVLCTLAWTAVEATELLHRHVPDVERDAYWRDMGRFGRLFGVPAHALPATYAEMSEHVDQHASEVLTVDDTARRLAGMILDPQPAILPRQLRTLPSVAAAALLPAAVREAYDLPWGPTERALWRAGRATARAAIPVLPPAIRFWPHYQVARRRIACAPCSG